jgi:protein tyrosine/serine phosphatase
MISKFIQVDNGLYRGSAPSPKDVQYLKEKYGINKIVSLDQAAADQIANTCKLLNIKQVVIPLDGTMQSLINLMSYDLKDLLINGGPTFIHCWHGKDRTGLVVALYECKYKGKDPEEAIKEAKMLGFGVGVDPKYINIFEKLIRASKPNTDNNNADIVSNEREYTGDSRDSFLDEANRSSFEAYMGKNLMDRDDPVYSTINNQSPTRENYMDKPIKEHSLVTSHIPQVGQYDNSAGIAGAGPSESVGGFIHD